MKTLYANYIDSFKGLSREIWLLALVTFINRAGTMIVPFLSKYLNEDLAFSKDDVAWILVFFGIGSMIGSYLGGKLTDMIGYYPVMVRSMLVAGVLFIGLQWVTSFWGLCLMILLIMSIADMFRPAMFVSMKAYCKPEDRSRAISLVRLAINLGFAMGPFFAGWMIVNSGYTALFWIDGLTAIASILMFMVLIKKKDITSYDSEVSDALEMKDPKIKTVYQDKLYLTFLGITFCMGMIFMQMFFTMPLYHEQGYGLDAFYTGVLFFMNGLIIVAIEMPVVHWIEKRKFMYSKLFLFSSILMFASFAVLLLDWGSKFSEVLVLNMLLITIAEIIAFPFTNTFAIRRAKKGNEGRYMGLYTMTFSAAHILCPAISLNLIYVTDFMTNWVLVSVFGLIAILLSVLLVKGVKKENETIKKELSKIPSATVVEPVVAELSEVEG